MLLLCPHCGAGVQPVHDRVRRPWRHLDSFQVEAWLHADVSRVPSVMTTHLAGPWARPGSGFKAAFEAALAPGWWSCGLYRCGMAAEGAAIARVLQSHRLQGQGRRFERGLLLDKKLSLICAELGRCAA